MTVHLEKLVLDRLMRYHRFLAEARGPFARPSGSTRLIWRSWWGLRTSGVRWPHIAASPGTGSRS